MNILFFLKPKSELAYIYDCLLYTSMREENIPLFALESQDPIKDFDFLGITIQYEMCYTNICLLYTSRCVEETGSRSFYSTAVQKRNYPVTSE